jgi:hypothetical protein
MTATKTSSILVAKDREMNSVLLNYPIEKCRGQILRHNMEQATHPQHIQSESRTLFIRETYR